MPPVIDVLPLSELIKSRRIDLGLSQADVASAMVLQDQPTVTGNDVARWERGKRIPRARARRALERVLGLGELMLDRAAAAQRAIRDASTFEKSTNGFGSSRIPRCMGPGRRRFDISVVQRTVELDFLDKDSMLVRQTRTARIRAASSNVRGYIDQMSTDGTIRDIEVRPGAFEQKRTEGGEMFLRVDFNRSLDEGEETDVSMGFDLVESFNDPAEEYWSLRVNHPTDLIRLVIRFHADRPHKAFKGYERFTSHESPFGIQPRCDRDDGRSILEWEIPQPSVGCVYKLCWDW